MKKKTKVILGIVVGIAILLLLCGFLFRDSLIRLYVKMNHERLEQYAQTCLSSGTGHDRYGPWEVACYQKKDMVQFTTGSFGIAPSSVYKGFYYSESGEHLAFQGADLPMKEEGNSATWTDGTDNGGSSVRITEHWFWFKAWF